MKSLKQYWYIYFFALNISLCDVDLCNAQKIYSEDELIKMGSDYYNTRKFPEAHLYLFAYWQRNPQRIRNDKNFRGQVINALEYAIANENCAGVDGKGDAATPPLDVTDVNVPEVKNSQVANCSHWNCTDGGTYYITQVGDQVWWFGQSADAGKSWSNVFHGQVTGNLISGSWADVAKGSSQNSGELVLSIESNKKIKIVRQTGGFSGSEWTAQPFMRDRNSFEEKIEKKKFEN